LFASLAAQGQKATISIASIESLIRSQKYDEALQSTETALRVAPNDFKVWTLQAIAHSLKGDRQDALRDFDKALSISPNYIAALKGEAQLLYPMRDKRAISVLNKIVQLSPKDSTAHEMLGVLEQKHGLCKEAIGNFLLSGEVIETHPASLEAYGFCLAQTEHLQQAIDVYGRLAALIPQSTYPRYDMAVLLVQTKQYEAAIKE
jgi:Flp pilus assembly protein TadD